MDALTLKTRYSVVDGIVGGIIGGIALGLTAMIGSLIIGKGLLHPLILTGYAFQPYEPEPVLTTDILIKAIGIHLVISMLGGLFFIAAANTFLSHKRLWFWGMVVGGMIWVVQILGGIQTLDPTMAAHMNHVGFFLGYMAYGAALGGYVGWAHERHLVKHRAV
jgi:hypothetical protein